MKKKHTKSKTVWWLHNKNAYFFITIKEAYLIWDLRIPSQLKKEQKIQTKQ